MALRVVSARRAFALLFKRDKQRKHVAEVVHVENGQYLSYDFKDWAEVSAMRRQLDEKGHDWVKTVRFDLAVPRIVRVLSFSKLPRLDVKFNRRNIFARDANTCQYCGKKFVTQELSFDHVIPRSQGGRSTWDNIVCACIRCNVRKGGRTPAQAHIRLIREPIKPKCNPMLQIKLTDERYASWKQFLDIAYWDVELK